jgi:hypothetical protein
MSTFVYRFGTHGDATLVFSRAIPIQNDDHMARIVTELSTIRGPWIWFFDCGDIQSLHMRYIHELASVLRTEHAHQLKQVWILNCNTWIRKILGLFSADKVHTVSAKGGRLEILDVLRKAGFTNQVADQVIGLVARQHS